MKVTMVKDYMSCLMVLAGLGLVVVGGFIFVVSGITAWSAILLIVGFFLVVTAFFRFRRR
jgi:hypothetical protein